MNEKLKVILAIAALEISILAIPLTISFLPFAQTLLTVEILAHFYLFRGLREMTKDD